MVGRELIEKAQRFRGGNYIKVGRGRPFNASVDIHMVPANGALIRPSHSDSTQRSAFPSGPRFQVPMEKGERRSDTSSDSGCEESVCEGRRERRRFLDASVWDGPKARRM